ncbi:hypothetical protein THTE_0148 [Thermogutta terrifontis]|uniref:Uncharacterized protein n=1 Tax=Thermogutta terrifontis TaxID=1331910 RepID=A0A286R9X5_9BACT|nr:right-handed parallel beta-helix repeat-containing protein [Thermogutta terrifontis]ASV72750.1 hypothetical protein THTE_0148 [Thermogutta terrifontis]
MRAIWYWTTCAAVLLVNSLDIRGEETVIYVSPRGNDAWSGRIESPNQDRSDGPLASLTAARDVIRKLRAEGRLGTFRVRIAPGEYTLSQPLVLEPQDSGTDASPVIYEAQGPEKPRFTGGRRITGWKKQPDGLWTTHIPEVAADQWYFEQLWVNGRRATRARSPNKFYFYVQRKIDHFVDSATGQSVETSNRAFQARREDIAPLFNIPRERLSDVTLVTYHSWETSRSRLAGVDPQQNIVTITAPIPWGFAYWGPNCRYHLENFRAALDEPGEWFLDRDGTLFYYPRPDEDMTTAVVIAPVVPEFVVIAGKPENEKWVEHVTLRGLVFEYSQYILPPEGHANSQAEVTIPAVIMLDGARHVNIEGCEIKHVGISGVWFRRGCTHCRIEKCWLDDLGGGGVKIGEGWGSDLSQPAVQTHHIVCRNNIIHSGGRIHHGAIGVWIGHSGYNEVLHNDISDFYYTGISVGWVWGYKESLAHHNRIEFNRIHHLGWGVLSDMGGVYTLGVSPGTTVSHNVIHDVYSYDQYGRGGWGLYNDEGSSYIEMKNNLVYRTKTGNYHQHYGRENRVENNIFAYSMDGQIQRSRVEEHISFFFERNIVLWDNGPLITAGRINDDLVKFASNLYWNGGREPIDFQGMTLEERQAKGWDVGSIIADPRFRDPEKGDFTLLPDSPAFKIGFVPFDYTQAGLEGDAEWRKIPESFEYPPVEFAPPPPPAPPLVLDESFEFMPAGRPPLEGQAISENRGDAVVVTTERASDGKKSLLLRDAEGLANVFNPHWIVRPNHTNGVTTLRFDVWLGPGALLFHEWRTWDSGPYQVGPSLWIREGRLTVGGKELAKLPLERWITLEIICPVGSSATGKWQLRVVGPDGEARFQDLPVGSQQFKDLTWIGWCSMAQTPTNIYIDRVILQNQVP